MKIFRCFAAFVCIHHPMVTAAAEAPSGMVLIPGGTFAMDSELPGSRMDEKPVIKVTPDGGWLDACDVTNADYRKFIDATGYSTIAERPIDWEEIKKSVPSGTPKPSPERLQPGAVIFSPQPRPIDPKPGEKFMANIWTGIFPVTNTAEDRPSTPACATSAPVARTVSLKPSRTSLRLELIDQVLFLRRVAL